MSDDTRLDPGGQRKLLQRFEALVRSQENKDEANLSSLAERLHKQWVSAGRPWLVIHANGMAVEEGEVLPFNEESCVWPLVLFLAGIHRIRPTEDGTPAQLLSLCDVLNSGSTEAKALAELRDYFWARTAAGFKVELRQGLFEALDVLRALDARPGYFPSQLVAQGSGGEEAQGAAPVGKGLSLDQVQALAALASRDDDDIPTLTPDAIALQSALADEELWQRIEIESALDNPTTRSSVPEEELVQVIEQFMQDDRIGWSLGELLGLLQHSDCDALQEILTPPSVVSHLVNQANLKDPAHGKALCEFGMAAPAAQRTELITALLHRGIEDELAVGALGELDGARLLSAVSVDQLDAPLAQVLFKALQATNVPGESLASLVESLPPPLRLSVVGALGDDTLERTRESMVQALVELAAEQSQEKALKGLALRACSGSDLILSDAYDQGILNQASKGVMVGCCRALARIPPEGSRLVDLVHDTKASEELRMSAFTALAHYPEQRLVAAARRGGEMLYPSRLRRALTKVRKQGNKR
jgi:hypothetical protein